MKQLSLLLSLGLGLLGFAGCGRNVVTFTAHGSATTFTPANVKVRLSRGDRVVFRNRDTRAHRLIVGGVTTTLFPLNPLGERPGELVWAIPPATTAPTSITWTCESHPGETGTITVEP